MRKQISPKKARKQRRAANEGGWAFSGAVTLGTITDESGFYYQTGATSVTFPSGTFSGFSVGDVITISGQEAKKKKKVHVARRRFQNREVTHTITNVSETTMTIATNDLVTATKIAEDCWSVHSTTGTITI